MAKGVQAFRANEIKRAVEALQKSGVKIARVSFENGRFDIITADGSRVETIWSSPQVGAFLHQTQYAHMHPAGDRAVDRQREGDVLRLKWSAYDGAVIRLKQRKGQRRGKKKNASAIVIIPVGRSRRHSTPR